MIQYYWDMALRNCMSGSRRVFIFKSDLVCFISQQAGFKKVIIQTSLCIIHVLNPYSNSLGLCFVFPSDYQDSAFKIRTTTYIEILTFRHRASCILGQAFHYSPENAFYTGCNRRNGPDFGRVFLRSNYTDITQNTYIQSSMVTEIMVGEV